MDHFDHVEQEPGDAHVAPVPTAFNALFFLVTMAIFAAGFWGMAEGFSQENGLFFSAGLLASCLAVGIAIHARQD